MDKFQCGSTCPICGKGMEKKKIDEIDVLKIECVNCRKSYYITDDVNCFRLSEEEKDMMLFYMNQNDKYCLFSKEQKIISGQFVNITLRELKENYPKKILRRVDMILLNLATLGINFGTSIDIGTNQKMTCINLNRLLFMAKKYPVRECYEVIEQLVKMGYVEYATKSGSTDNSSIILSAKGLLRLEKLQELQEEVPQAFIAMWFDESMSKARNSISKAIQDCGYLPVLIDEKEHNNQIVPEIFYEINRSRFVVADLTGNRGGVYYEAGYAEALKKEVIITFKKSEDKQVHFDVAQKSSIYWEDEEELYTRLVRRINATVGQVKNI